MNEHLLTKITVLIEKLGGESKEAFYVYLGYEIVSMVVVAVTVSICVKRVLSFFAAGRAAVVFERDIARAANKELVYGDFGNYMRDDDKNAVIELVRKNSSK